MSKANIKGSLLLLLTSVIWGFAFSFQKGASEYLRPFTLNAGRFIIGGIVLLPIVLIMYRGKMHVKKTVSAGLLLGIILFAACNLQQFGIELSTSGKSGFITALYIVILPLLGLFFKKKPTVIMWLGVFLALAGFWLLSRDNGGGFGVGELVLVLSAVLFAFHILLVDIMSEGADPLGISLVQIAVAGVLSMICSLVFEPGNVTSVTHCIPELLYLGVLSSGVGYTLQIVGQQYAEPVPAALMMSLESVFAAVSGAIMLNESMNFIEIIGCALIFAAVIITSVIPEIVKKRKAK